MILVLSTVLCVPTTGRALPADGCETQTDRPPQADATQSAVTTTPTFSAGARRVLFEGPFRTDGPFRGYDVTPDGQHFLMVREIAQPAARLSQIVLVQNWTEELKRVVPAK